MLRGRLASRSTPFLCAVVNPRSHGTVNGRHTWRAYHRVLPRVKDVVPTLSHNHLPRHVEEVLSLFVLDPVFLPCLPYCLSCKGFADGSAWFRDEQYRGCGLEVTSSRYVMRRQFRFAQTSGRYVVQVSLSLYRCCVHSSYPRSVNGCHMCTCFAICAVA